MLLSFSCKLHLNTLVRRLPVSETTMSIEKHVSLFGKGQIINMYQAEKTFMEISKTFNISLRAVQYILINWKNNSEEQTIKCRGKIVLNYSFVT